MWVEIVEGQVGQQIDDNAPVTAADGTQYPAGWPKAAIPNLVNVMLAEQPDPTKLTVTGSTIQFANGTATQVLTTEPVPGPTLAEAQTAQVSILTAACNTAIVGGYTSSALGAVHSYPNNPIDQINMLSALSESMQANLAVGWTTAFWCADSSGTWAMQPHIGVQIQQAAADMKAWVDACRIKLASRTAAVQGAATVAAVQAVSWA
jgi:hypothetical protein